MKLARSRCLNSSIIVTTWLMSKPAAGPVLPASDRLISELTARSGAFAIVPAVGVEGDVPLAQRWRSVRPRAQER